MLSSLDINVDSSDGEITLSVPFKLSPEQVADLLNFDNSNNVAYALYHRELPAAKALYEELKYWIEGKE